MSETVSLTAAAQSKVDPTGCPHCGCRRLQGREHASGLRRLPAQLQRADGNTIGPSAPEGEMGGSDGGPDNRRMLGQSGGTLRRRRLNRVPLAPPVSLCAGARQAGPTHRDRRSRRDLCFGIVQGKRAALPRPARKRSGKASKRGLSAEQIPVLVARDRTGQTTDAVLAKLDRASVSAVLAGVVTPENQLCFDGGRAIVSFARKAKIPCCILPKPGGPRPEAPNLHINNVNGYHSRLKEWLRPFHGVATEYLDHYLSWRRTIEAFGSDPKRQDWLCSAIGLTNN
jgi:ISXO2-like transposase domain